MFSVFHLEALQRLLQDFYRITRIRITVFDADMRELVSWPEEFLPFCSAIRATEQGRAACQRCDREACAAAAERRGAYIYRCHAGLTEAVVPLHVGDVLVGYLWCGHVFSYPGFEEGMVEISRCCAALPVNQEELRAACALQPIITEEYVRSAARILHATASYLILERMATLREDSAAARLDAYLSAHADQPVTVAETCEALGLSRSRLYRLCSQLYGCGLSARVRALRIDRAKRLLTERAELSIAEVAAQCGFLDYNYFIAVFSRETGESPNAYRKRRTPVPPANNPRRRS
ncbi:MAG: PocR ligand-binding domain-containing protein [Aristaeellaceae bacterium]